jgi:glycosyltransferase involved in cell wall biosynthesis
MIVGYLVNQYPKVSHSFIRREILALEQLGFVVHRFSIRPSQSDLADSRDTAETPKTTVILKDKVRLAFATLSTAVRTPVRFARALQEASQLQSRSDRGSLTHLAYVVEACALLQESRKRNIQHLHAHFGTNPAAVALLYRLLGGTPYSFTVHGPEEFDKAPLLSLHRKAAAAKFVVAISDYGRSQLMRLVARQDGSRIRVVRCGLDEELLSAAPVPIPDVSRLVCIGRLSEQKGHFVLLDAVARLAREGYEFKVVFVGGGELRPELERYIDELRIRTHVAITGYVGQDRVVEELRSSRALVLPSLGEGLPVVIMEAFAAGRPVISTYVAGIPELVTPGTSGWLVPAGSVELLAAAIRQVLTTPVEKLQQMARVGHEAVATQHAISGSARQLGELFAEA